MRGRPLHGSHPCTRQPAFPYSGVPPNPQHHSDGIHEPGIPLRMDGPLELSLRLPAYTARGQLYLGRVVSAQPARFTLEPQ